MAIILVFETGWYWNIFFFQIIILYLISEDYISVDFGVVFIFEQKEINSGYTSKY